MSPGSPLLNPVYVRRGRSDTRKFARDHHFLVGIPLCPTRHPRKHASNSFWVFSLHASNHSPTPRFRLASFLDSAYYRRLNFVWPFWGSYTKRNATSLLTIFDSPAPPSSKADRPRHWRPFFLACVNFLHQSSRSCDYVGFCFARSFIASTTPTGHPHSPPSNSKPCMLPLCCRRWLWPAC